MGANVPAPEIYQLRIALREISPAIWRRVLVQSDSTIEDLHYTVQIAMGWTDSHLNRFVIRGKDYGVPHIGGIWFMDDARKVRLADFGFRLRERFLYEYDFGDRWRHDIRVERELLLDSKRTYPICIGGRRAAPPEDCGGPWAFMELEQRYSVFSIAERLGEILSDEEGYVDDYQEELETLRYWASLEHFDRRQVNRRLKQYASGDDEWRWEWA